MGYSSGHWKVLGKRHTAQPRARRTEGGFLEEGSSLLKDTGGEDVPSRWTVRPVAGTERLLQISRQEAQAGDGGKQEEVPEPTASPGPALSGNHSIGEPLYRGTAGDVRKERFSYSLSHFELGCLLAVAQSTPLQNPMQKVRAFPVIQPLNQKPQGSLPTGADRFHHTQSVQNSHTRATWTPSH